jgi:hypothetical protein
MSTIASTAAAAAAIGGPYDEQHVVRCSTGMEVHIYRGADGAWVIDVEPQSLASLPPGLEPVQLRAQLRWLLTHDGHPAADGIQALLTMLLAQLDPGP